MVPPLTVQINVEFGRPCVPYRTLPPAQASGNGCAVIMPVKLLISNNTRNIMEFLNDKS
jgi:hypothetical protein